MATGLTGGIGDITKLTELRRRLLFLLGALIVFRIGAHIPVPGINANAFQYLFEQEARDTILGMFNMFSGGALERFSIFALGIMPYISAAIIMQLMTAVIPSLEALRKEGEAGRRKITQYTRYGTLVLATFQSIGVAIALQAQSGDGVQVVSHPGLGFIFTATVTLVTGTMFLMWLGEQVTERGLGNGISMIIFAGIVAGLPSTIADMLQQTSRGQMSALELIGFLLIAVLVTAFVVFVESGQRRITVNYAKRQQGRKMMQGQSTHLPLKLNMAGVIPPIFASSILLFPASMGTWFGRSEGMSWLSDLATLLSPGQPIYVALYASAIIFFCFFYTALVFNSRETAENLKKSGAFVPGIRPGDQTARYIDGVLTRLTLAGALYITAVCLLPEFIIIARGVSFYFGGTSLLIIVVVVMDFLSQVQSHLMSHQYESLMKKAKI